MSHLKLSRLLPLFLMLVLSACGLPEHNALPPGSTILAFCDSLTAGVGTSSDKSYPTVLAELTGLEVVNAGVSGETTEEGLPRLRGLLPEVQPDLLILIEGGNDILRNKRFSDAKSNLAQMIEMALQEDIPVIFLGVPEKNLFSSTAPFYKELAAEYPVIFDGGLIADLLRSPSLKSDPVHLNAKGYREMAESIYELMEGQGLVN